MILGFKKSKNHKVNTEEKVITEYLEFLYRYFLNRDPDEEGFRIYSHNMRIKGPAAFKDTLISFLESKEYNLFPSNLNLEKSKEFIFDDISEEQLNYLFEKTAFFWRNSGAEPNNIYWSVISSIEHKKKLSPIEIRSFLKSGEAEVKRIKKICEFVGYDFSKCKNFLDFGCGVGRIVVNLPCSVENVNCVDFSQAHLKETEKNIRINSQLEKYSTFLIKKFDDIYKLPNNQDIIHSFIVLQHNTPPIIEKTIENLLNILSPSGLAILHIPITKSNYEFEVNDYLIKEDSGKTMEMHILPKSNLYKIAKRNNSRIAYSF